MNEFYVGGYRVDMSRSQIVAQENIMSVEPKVLQVLLILAKNQGQVVSHETILSQVWPDVVVAPNALQRCIAQLRKAFGDDAKTQKVIATHPKIGYSLLAHVDWQDAVDKAQSKTHEEPPKTPLNRPFIWLGGAALVVVAILGLVMLKPTEDSLPLTRLTALTATDNKEFYPSFSPDGRYIAFQRFIEICKSQIWVKDLVEQREILLTRDLGVYGPPAWSPDGQQLAFSYIAQCSQEVPDMGCASIHGLNFPLAKAKPQPTQKLLACDDFSFGGVNWMGNDKLVFKATKESKGEVQTLSLANNEVATLFQQDNFKPYALSYSQTFEKLAVSGFDPSHKVDLVFIGAKGEYQQVPFEVPDDHSAIDTWELSWHPTEPFLLTSGGRALFKISMQGEFTEYPVPTFQTIYNPVYHPDGTRIAATMGTLDFDIAQLENLGQSADEVKTEVKHRSIVEDYQAQYQPSGHFIAFISSRSGSEQVWLDEAGQLRQLSSLNRGQWLEDYIWAKDGRYILAIVNGALQFLHLDGQMQPLEAPFKAVRMYQWLSERELMLGVVHQQRQKVVKFDIQSGELHEVYNGFTMWGQMDAKGELYYLDDNRRVMRLVDGQSEVLPSAKDHPVWSRFYIKQQQLFFVDSRPQMWQVDLEQGSKRKIATTGTGELFWQLDDLDLSRKTMLFSKVHAARKEIVMFE